jgi:uncharacterized membrane protein YhhN
MAVLAVAAAGTATLEAPVTGTAAATFSASTTMITIAATVAVTSATAEGPLETRARIAANAGGIARSEFLARLGAASRRASLAGK